MSLLLNKNFPTLSLQSLCVLSFKYNKGCSKVLLFLFFLSEVIDVTSESFDLLYDFMILMMVTLVTLLQLQDAKRKKHVLACDSLSFFLSFPVCRKES